MTRQKRWWAGLAGVGAVHLGALACGADDVAAATKALLMPAVAGAVVSARRVDPRSHPRPAAQDRLVRHTLAALALSWLGDVAPRFSGEQGFLVMIGFFLLAQLCYISGFWPMRGDSALHSDRWRAAAYAVAAVALVAACAPGAGDLLVPAAVYGACLGVMAVLSTGIAAPAAAGGLLFFVSDALIALENFTRLADDLPPGAAPVAVMATYIAGQALLASGVIRQIRGAPPAGSR